MNRNSMNHSASQFPYDLTERRGMLLMLLDNMKKAAHDFYSLGVCLITLKELSDEEYASSLGSIFEDIYASRPDLQACAHEDAAYGSIVEGPDEDGDLDDEPFGSIFGSEDEEDEEQEDFEDWLDSMMDDLYDLLHDDLYDELYHDLYEDFGRPYDPFPADLDDE